MVEIDDVKSPECCSFFIIWSLAQLWYLIGTWPNGFMQSDNNSPDYLHWAHAGEKNNSRIQETLSASDLKLVSTDLILVHVIKGKWIVCLSLLWMLLLSPYPKLQNHTSENAGVSCCFPGMEMDSKTTCIASVDPFWGQWHIFVHDIGGVESVCIWFMCYGSRWPLSKHRNVASKGTHWHTDAPNEYFSRFG